MVNIDTVYQRVLALANKEQRGYITPQEFNLFANQAQMDIFEQYFYDLNQFLRIPGNSTEHSDMVGILEEKISIFEAGSPVARNATLGIYNAQLANLYRMSTVRYNDNGQQVLINRVSEKELRMITISPLTKPTKKRPVYISKNNIISVYPITPGSITVSYIKKPAKVEWSSVSLVGNELYDSTNSVDFELHPSEETKLVIKVLSLSGITLKDPSLYQIAGAEDNKNIQQEKQ
tara:strand:+ start:98 stop:796 length:699 start_codon:yes stop_codon:yes gene_type:complete